MSGFESWAIVELMGHAKIAGKVTEQVIAGGAFLRVDVPAVDDKQAYSKFYTPNAVYCITPTDEATGMAAARSFSVPPVQPWVVNFPMLQDKIDVVEDDEAEYSTFDPRFPEDIPF